MSRIFAILLCLLCMVPVVAFSAEEETPADPNEALRFGEKAYSEQLYGIAREKLEQFLKDNPDTPEKARVQELLAKSLYHLRDYARAESVLTSLLGRETKPEKRADLQYWLGRSHLRLGKHEQAIRDFDAAASLEGDNPILPYAKIDRAICTNLLGESDEAIESLDAVIKEYAGKDPGTYAQLEKSRLLITEGQYEKSRDALLLLIEMKMPKELQSRLFFLLGEAEYNLGKYDEAIAYYLKSLETGTYYDWFPEASYAIGWCHLRKGDSEKASKAFADLLNENPGKEMALKAELGAARTLLLQKKPEDAVKALQTIISTSPGKKALSEATYLLGNAAVAMKDYEGAIQDYDKVIQEYADSEFVPDAHFGKGSALFVQKKYDESIEEFRLCADRSGRSDLVQAAMLRTGDAYYELSKFQKALEAYGVVESSPEQDLLLLKMGWCQYKLGNFDDAITEFKRVEEEFPKSEFADDALYRSGACYSREPDYRKAIEVYESLKTKYPKSTLLDRAAFQTGMCYSRLNELDSLDKAEAAFVEVVKNYPESPLADRADFEIGWCKFYREYDPSAAKLEAEEHFKKHIKERPKSQYIPEILFWLGEQAYNRGAFADALGRFSSLRKKYPDSFLADEAYYWSGRSALNLEKTEDALAEFEGLLKDFPDSEFAVDSEYHAAVCKLTLGKTEDGLAMLLALEAKPGSDYLADEIRLHAAQAYFTLDKIDEAYDEYKALSRSRDEKFKAQGLYGMGLYNQRKKRYRDAILLFMEVAWDFSDQENIASLSYLSAGECYAAQGRKREAIERYAVIVEEDLPDAEEAAKRIKSLKGDSTYRYE